MERSCLQNLVENFCFNSLSVTLLNHSTVNVCMKECDLLKGGHTFGLLAVKGTLIRRTCSYHSQQNWTYARVKLTIKTAFIWRKEGHPPSQVSFSEDDLFANSARACSDCLALTEFTRLGRGRGAEGYPTTEERVTKGDPARRITLLAVTTVCFSVRHFL